jgi:hypothetical protein
MKPSLKGVTTLGVAVSLMAALQASVGPSEAAGADGTAGAGGGPAAVGSAQPSAAVLAKLLACNLDCAALETKTSLVLEYELCGATEQARAAELEARVLPIKSDDTLSPGGACLVGALSAQAKSTTASLIIVPRSSPRRRGQSQALSANLSLLRACLSPIGASGAVPRAHRDLAGNALRNSPGFGYGNKLMELASEQADGYEWRNPAAHAQMPDGPNATKLAAIAAFSNHLKKVTSSITKACCRNDKRLAAYQMGYLFHAIQDLATHAGISNEYHAYMLPRGNPDIESTNLNRAEAWSIEVLNTYADSLYGACVKDASQIDAAGVDWNALATSGDWGIFDGTTAELKKFLGGALRLTAPPKQTWFNQANATEANTWFSANVMNVVKDSLRVPCQ